jgi:hypothetical protein
MYIIMKKKKTKNIIVNGTTTAPLVKLLGMCTTSRIRDKLY